MWPHNGLGKLVLSPSQMWMTECMSENIEIEKFGDRMHEGGISGWMSWNLNLYQQHSDILLKYSNNLQEISTNVRNTIAHPSG